jgi:hypothetical protein
MEPTKLKNDAQMKIRLPAELKDWIVACATASDRTLNGEIVHLLKTVQAEAIKR